MLNEVQKILLTGIAMDYMVENLPGFSELFESNDSEFKVSFLSRMGDYLDEQLIDYTAQVDDKVPNSPGPH